MEHRANLEKSDKTTQDWVEGQTFFRGFSRFVQLEELSQTNTPLPLLIDETSFFDTFRSREDIKPEFRGQLLGHMMRSYVTQYPDILDTLCEVHEKADQSLDVLYGIRDLWMNVPGATYQENLKGLFDAMAERMRRKNKAEIKQSMMAIKEFIGSPQLKALFETRQLPTPLRKQMERPLSDSDSEKSGSGKVSPSTGVNRVLEEQFKALSLEAAEIKENLVAEVSKRLEAEQKIADESAKRREAEQRAKQAEDEVAVKDSKLVKVEQRAKQAEDEVAQLRAMLAALQGKK